VPPLKALAEAGHEVACVYTRAPRPAGRGQQERKTPVHQTADTLGLAVRTPRSLKNDDEAAAFKALGNELAQRRKSLRETEDGVRTTMVMEEMPKPRDTFLLLRGQYDKKGEKVTAKTPAALPPLHAVSETPNRLDLARWIVSISAHNMSSLKASASKACRWVSTVVQCPFTIERPW